MKEYLRNVEKSSLVLLCLLEAGSVITLFFCVKHKAWLFCACVLAQMILLLGPLSAGIFPAGENGRAFEISLSPLDFRLHRLRYDI